MKILVITHSLSFGGAQNLLYNLLFKIKSENIEIKFISLDYGTGYYLEKIKRLGELIIYDHSKKEDLDDFIEDIDIIFGNTVVAGRIYPYLSKFKKKIITYVHELQMSIDFYAAYCILDTIKYTDKFLCVSEAVKNNLIKTYSVPSEKIKVIYASIDPICKNVDLRINKKLLIREREGLNIENFIVVGCGIGMAFRKGIDRFYDIYCILRERKKNISFYWIGDFTDEDYIESIYINANNANNANNPNNANKYLFLKEEINRQENIHILGFVENSREIISCADLYLLTSRSEPCALSALEAADYEIPIICYENSGGICEFIGDSSDMNNINAGFIIKNEEECVEKIMLLEKDRDLLKKLGRKAKQRLLENYILDISANKILQEVFYPKIHIILPNYNHEKYLRKRLDSIYNQTYKNFDLLILDDCSTDNSVNIIREYIISRKERNQETNEERNNVIINNKNSGSTFKQWVKGLERIEDGELVWIAESDDVSSPYFLEEMVKYFVDNNIVLAYCDSHIIDSEDKIIGNYQDTNYLRSISEDKWSSSYILEGKEEIIFSLGIKNTILNASSVLFRKRDFTKIGSMLERMKIAGDWLLYLFLLSQNNSKIAYLNKRLNYHRRHDNSVLGNELNREEKYLTLFKEIKICHKYVYSIVDYNQEHRNKIREYVEKQFRDLKLENDVEYYYPINIGFMGLKEREMDIDIKEILKDCGGNTRKSDILRNL